MGVCAPIGDELRNKYGSDFQNVCMASALEDYVLAVGNKKILGSGLCVEPNFPSMFSLRILKGNINALNDPSAVLLSASLAKALFGKEDAMNKVIKFENGSSYKVTGVYEDIPRNSTFYETGLLLPWKRYIIEGWPRFEHASVYNLWQMLSKEFALLVIISCFIAIPLAWYYLNNWLQQYDYKTTISFWIFILSGLGALMITTMTVSFQAIKAAIANPVKSLRTE